MPDGLYPPSVESLIEAFATLPGIGKRSAERMAYHLLGSPRDEAMNLAVAIRDVKKNIKACSRCFHVAEGELCQICTDARRDAGCVCVVELPRDVIAIEKTGAYQGQFHVLQGRLAPLDGTGPDDLRIAELIRRIQDSQDAETPVREVILAMNPSTEGDATAAYLAEVLAELPVTVSRLARGLSSGTDLESAPPSTLTFAFEGRHTLRGGSEQSGGVS